MRPVFYFDEDSAEKALVEALKKSLIQGTICYQQYRLAVAASCYSLKLVQAAECL